MSNSIMSMMEDKMRMKLIQGFNSEEGRDDNCGRVETNNRSDGFGGGKKNQIVA
jgi:hypothetical protein